MGQDVVPPGAGRVTVPAGVPAVDVGAGAGVAGAGGSPVARRVGRPFGAANGRGADARRGWSGRRRCRGAGVRGVRVGTAGVRTTAVIAGGPAPVPVVGAAAPGRAPWPSKMTAPRIATTAIGRMARPTRRRSRGMRIAGPSRSKSSSKSRSRPGGRSAPECRRRPRRAERSRSSRHSAEAGKLPPAPARPTAQAGRRVGRAERRLVDRGQDALAVAVRDRRRVAARQERPLQERVGPGPTATSASAAASGEKPAAATRSASRPKASVSRAASAAVGRRSMRQRSTGSPGWAAARGTSGRRGGRSRGRRRPRCSRSRTSGRPPRPARPRPTRRRRTRSAPGAPRPERVSSASTGPNGWARARPGWSGSGRR